MQNNFKSKHHFQIKSNLQSKNFQTWNKYMRQIGIIRQRPFHIVMTSAMTNINQIMMTLMQSLGNGSLQQSLGEWVQCRSLRWSMLIEHVPNKHLQMLLLISHNADLHVACGCLSVESIIMCAVWTLTCVYMVLFLAPVCMHAYFRVKSEGLSICSLQCLCQWQWH